MELLFRAVLRLIITPLGCSVNRCVAATLKRKLTRATRSIRSKAQTRAKSCNGFNRVTWSYLHGGFTCPSSCKRNSPVTLGS
ncbi:uncharacterized protein PHACADRAFT_260085 [Phanerochaete carnosa HHB-10118-sp]|uniref:Secreted protein n=1 Tax=Phanerochaete carnosa (strain HHB-10118-sp) TaxID=650164 RepID=K5VQ69_PHACS|nr:uncharacterized protein PHACADRAFT_260085 [Phanerochaete carnosa HHB-10118-sp]EKM53628.1 hypothetical protein PHACADRAFT_260085 [Phanerochaete carnosa HHB-10118-sp]